MKAPCSTCQQTHPHIPCEEYAEILETLLQVVGPEVGVNPEHMTLSTGYDSNPNSSTNGHYCIHITFNGAAAESGIDRHYRAIADAMQMILHDDGDDPFPLSDDDPTPIVEDTL